ncbi:hypothetical protein AKJ16_DCAP12926 [Drosera capensis]
MFLYLSKSKHNASLVMIGAFSACSNRDEDRKEGEVKDLWSLVIGSMIYQAKRIQARNPCTVMHKDKKLRDQCRFIVKLCDKR